MLTRHLYEIDEVVAALQLCLRNGWTRAIFWVWELVVSDEYERALTTIHESWLRWGGQDPMLLAVRPPTAEAWIALILRTMAAIRVSPNATDCLEQAAKAEWRPSVTPPTTAKNAKWRAGGRIFAAATNEIDATDAANWWISLDSACRQGSRRDAFWLLQAAIPVLSADAIWTALTTVIAERACGDAIRLISASATAHPEQQALAQGAAILLLCSRSAEPIQEFKPHTVQVRDWATWTENIGRRAARVHAIPAEALHAGTTRGAMSRKYTNIDEVRDPIPLLAQGCEWWRCAVELHGIREDTESGTLAFPSDDVLEDFVDGHFPDDIPDEWSKADQQKSHGQGCAESAPPAPTVLLREEPVSLRRWRMATHVR